MKSTIYIDSLSTQFLTNLLFYDVISQVNYATTKSGVWELTKALSVEGRKYKIGVNAVAAVAGTALTQSGTVSARF